MTNLNKLLIIRRIWCCIMHFRN